MDSYSSEDDLPELSAILHPKPLMATSTNTAIRRSPRKKAPTVIGESRSPQKRMQGNTRPARATTLDSKRPSTKMPYTPRSTKATNGALSLSAYIPILPRNVFSTETTATSNNRRSPGSCQRDLKLARVDSLLLPLRAMAMEEQNPKLTASRPLTKAGGCRVISNSKTSIMSLMTEAGRNASPGKRGQASRYTSRFVLSEARCNDDEDSMDEEDEDDDTDLSGFIMDDAAELSYHDTSASESEDGQKRRPPKNEFRTAPRRRLQRGSRPQRRQDSGEEESVSDKENRLANSLSDALRHMALNGGSCESKAKEIEVIDLTSSPTGTFNYDLNTQLKSISTTRTLEVSPVKRPSHTSNLFDDFDAILKLSPPLSDPTLVLPSKMKLIPDSSMTHDEESQDRSTGAPDPDFKTPPATPPQSPSKLNSPSKLLSPSKRQAAPQSPHRQSMDAFWDHNVVNEWNDEYSPKKTPAPSPKRQGLARFQIWTDSEDEGGEDRQGRSSDGLPSPWSSPRKEKSRSRSPMKSPEKEEKKRLLEEKRAAAARKKDFDSRKERLALDLLHELDSKVVNSQLQRLTSSTGGVQIVWSKTLRSTAGRANWKRTGIKPSGSPIKGGEENGAGYKVQHSAKIELAEKIIDSEDRLVNTLAHEFCHLTNFMISNVRDQPHGASFKAWAAKVTSHLRQSDVEIWRNVQVTTKHSYEINHKYLWVCTGRDQTPAMEFLSLKADEGCGTEYGRQSKSINTDKHRCGKCKGRLVQVRPKPRASPTKKLTLVKREGSAEYQRSSSGTSSRSGSSGVDTWPSVSAAMIETVELSD